MCAPVFVSFSPAVSITVGGDCFRPRIKQPSWTMWSFLSLALTQTHNHIKTYTEERTHTLSLSLSYTHIHTQTSLSLSITHKLSFSNTHIYTPARTHTYAHTHTHTDCSISLLFQNDGLQMRWAGGGCLWMPSHPANKSIRATYCCSSVCPHHTQQTQSHSPKHACTIRTHMHKLIPEHKQRLPLTFIAQSHIHTYLPLTSHTLIHTHTHTHTHTHMILHIYAGKPSVSS